MKVKLHFKSDKGQHYPGVITLITSCLSNVCWSTRMKKKKNTANFTFAQTELMKLKLVIM